MNIFSWILFNGESSATYAFNLTWSFKAKKNTKTNTAACNKRFGRSIKNLTSQSRIFKVIVLMKFEETEVISVINCSGAPGKKLDISRPMSKTCNTWNIPKTCFNTIGIKNHSGIRMARISKIDIISAEIVGLLVTKFTFL